MRSDMISLCDANERALNHW